MKVLFAVAGLLLVVWTEPAFACSCNISTVSAGTYRQWLDGFDGVVFRGVVRELTLEKSVGTKATFQVERHWKGITSPVVVIYVPRTVGNCAVEFRRSGTYVIAAQWANDRLNHHLCLRMLTDSDPAAFLRALGEGSLPPKGSLR
jgi:hypothetical protein